jgi:hypothetical protein
MSRLNDAEIREFQKSDLVPVRRLIHQTIKQRSHLESPEMGTSFVTLFHESIDEAKGL